MFRSRQPYFSSIRPPSSTTAHHNFRVIPRILTAQIRFNGINAIKCATVFKPEFVILDIGLPDMTGYDVALRMRQIAGLESVTLVALTGYGKDKDKRLAAAAGFDRHMVKPITFKDIGELMQ